VLVQNTQGYLNLCELLSRAWIRNAVKAQAVCKLGMAARYSARA
jgi:DNA polymerase-3 subunit alpha